MQKVENAIQMPSTVVTTDQAASPGADGATTSVQLHDAPLDVLYQHGGEWVRMTNGLIWTIGTLFVPASFLMLGYTATHDLSSASRGCSAVGSLLLFFSWVYISRLYGESSSVARAVLMRVEASWKLPRELSLYTLQDPVVKRGPRGVNIRTFQRIFLGILTISWLVVLFADEFGVTLYA